MSEPDRHTTDTAKRLGAKVQPAMRVLVPTTVVLAVAWMLGWLPLWPALVALVLAIGIPAAAGFVLSGSVGADLSDMD